MNRRTGTEDLPRDQFSEITLLFPNFSLLFSHSLINFLGLRTAASSLWVTSTAPSRSGTSPPSSCSGRCEAARTEFRCSAGTFPSWPADAEMGRLADVRSFGLLYGKEVAGPGGGNVQAWVIYILP